MLAFFCHDIEDLPNPGKPGSGLRTQVVRVPPEVKDFPGAQRIQFSLDAGLVQRPQGGWKVSPQKERSASHVALQYGRTPRPRIQRVQQTESPGNRAVCRGFVALVVPRSGISTPNSD